MKSPIVDVPVALIFFNRPEVFKMVFECVKKNRPSKLFLIQDGPREKSKTDKEKIAQCRFIAEQIDWECEVHRDYSEKNLGCGRRVFSGLSKAFEIVDRLVVVEDDILFCDSFLPYCAELLERYKDDERIGLISGMNQLGTYQLCPNSYFFSQGGGAIWGWATWRRVWQLIDWTLPFSNDSYINTILQENSYYGNIGRSISSRSKAIAQMIQEGKAPSFWSFHFGSYVFINNQINIVPKKNMISNIGLTEESAHAVNSLKKLPRNIRKLFYTEMYEMDFPMKHPNYVIDDRHYFKLQDDLLHPKGLKKYLYRMDSLIRR